MTKLEHFGVPGIGGSLGKCAVCGKNFLTEILLGKAVPSFKIDTIDKILYGHNSCIKLLKRLESDEGLIDARNLPDGPIKEAFLKHQNQKD